VEHLNAYLRRIGYAGPLVPTLDVLRGIVFAHACSIPFENLDVLLGRGISIDESAVDRKLIDDRRGGYCFEQNTLLLRALTAIGFRAEALSARVGFKVPREQITPRTHVFLRLTIDGVPWLADCGVGGMTPTAPLRLDVLDDPQSTPHDARRLVRDDTTFPPTYYHQMQMPTGWADVYRYTLEPMPPIDRELANWWTSASPKSRFREALMAARANRDGTRVTLLNGEFTRRRGGEIVEQRVLTDPEELLVLLAREFGLSFPAGTRFGPPGAVWPS
jgi:N-hydroxyarylamine O-acetyltransferase